MQSLRWRTLRRWRRCSSPEDRARSLRCCAPAGFDASPGPTGEWGVGCYGWANGSPVRPASVRRAASASVAACLRATRRRGDPQVHHPSRQNTRSEQYVLSYRPVMSKLGRFPHKSMKGAHGRGHGRHPGARKAPAESIEDQSQRVRAPGIRRIPQTRLFGVSPAAADEWIVVCLGFGVEYGSVPPKPGCAGPAERNQRYPRAS